MPLARISASSLQEPSVLAAGAVTAQKSRRGRPGVVRTCTSLSTRPASTSWSRCDRTVLPCSPTSSAMAGTSIGPSLERRTSRTATRLAPDSTRCLLESTGSGCTSLVLLESLVKTTPRSYGATAPRTEPRRESTDPWDPGPGFYGMYSKNYELTPTGPPPRAHPVRRPDVPRDPPDRLDTSHPGAGGQTPDAAERRGDRRDCSSPHRPRRPALRVDDGRDRRRTLGQLRRAAGRPRRLVRHGAPAACACRGDRALLRGIPPGEHTAPGRRHGGRAPGARSAGQRPRTRPRRPRGGCGCGVRRGALRRPPGQGERAPPPRAGHCRCRHRRRPRRDPRAVSYT